MFSVLESLENVHFLIHHNFPDQIERRHAWDHQERFVLYLERLFDTQSVLLIKANKINKISYKGSFDFCQTISKNLEFCDNLIQICEKIIFILQEYKDDYETDNETDILDVR